jgi:phage tail sheath protein FI
MNTMFRQGAFQGLTKDTAYFVRCDSSTTTQSDIDLGVVNVVVGFAALRPAEFVVVTVTQMAGQVQS